MKIFRENWFHDTESLGWNLNMAYVVLLVILIDLPKLSDSAEQGYLLSGDSAPMALTQNLPEIHEISIDSLL